MVKPDEPLPDTPGVKPRRFRLNGVDYLIDGLPVQVADPWTLVVRDGAPLTERQFIELPEAVRLELISQVGLYLMANSGG